MNMDMGVEIDMTIDMATRTDTVLDKKLRALNTLFKNRKGSIYTFKCVWKINFNFYCKISSMKLAL
jgi:hypothetical protein